MYTPVARISFIRVLLVLASIYGLFVQQMDVKTVFLNGELDEEIYMEQPEGFILSIKKYFLKNTHSKLDLGYLLKYYF